MNKQGKQNNIKTAPARQSTLELLADWCSAWWLQQVPSCGCMQEALDSSLRVSINTRDTVYTAEHQWCWARLSGKTDRLLLWGGVLRRDPHYSCSKTTADGAINEPSMLAESIIHVDADQKVFWHACR
jgi:hypothetical protein